MDTNFQPITSTNARGRHRQHSLEFKRALVALSLEPGVSVVRIAHEHGVNANKVFSWRRLYQKGRLGVLALMRADGLLPVVLAPNDGDADADSDVGGTIVLELGEVRVRIEGQPKPLFCCDAAKCHYGSMMIVGSQPAGCKILDFVEHFKHLVGQPVVTYRSVIAFRTSVLLRLAWLDKVDSYPVLAAQAKASTDTRGAVIAPGDQRLNRIGTMYPSTPAGG